MSDIFFPGELLNRQDSAQFSIQPLSKSVKGEMEGGFTHARPRTTRPHRKQYTTGLRYLTQVEADILMSFYEQVGGYQSFMWKVNIMGDYVEVRFEEPPNLEYVGVGSTIRYDANGITLKEA